MMTAPMTFGGWLKRRRISLGLTQKELARQVGYAQVTLRKVEADELRCSGQMAKKLAEALELAPEEQIQFVRFARDEAYWDDLTLPERAQAPAIPAEQRAEPPDPSLEDKQSLPALTVPTPQLSGDTLDRPRLRHNLPAQTTPLIGREEELAELVQLLADPGTRLITILSAGGMGKTHLATAAAWQQVERFTHGVRWVPLAPLTEARELVLAIAAALGLQLQGERTPEQQVGDYLQAKHLLLVLDNFEHLIEGATLVGELLARAPQLSILITSRQRLKLSSEAVIYLDGLRFPADDATDPLAYPAIQLFLLHAGRVRPHYQPHADDVAGMVAVCRLVYGMPLGVLLAAAWSGVISPAQIAAEIGKDLSFLQSDMPDVPARQRNLRVVFLHTWGRLHPAERNVFMRLSVFRGGATTEAAQQVTGATLDVLGGLIDKALLRRLPNGRLDIHELLRQFAAEHLAGTNAVDERKHSEARLQHSRYYLNLFGEQEQPLQGPQQRAALDLIRADFENISVAWRWAVQQHEFVLLAAAVHPLFLYCDVRGAYREGVILFAAAAEELDAELMTEASDQPCWQALRERVIVRLGGCEVLLGNYGHGEQLLIDSLPRIEEERERAFALLYLGQAATERGELALADIYITQSLEISRQCTSVAGMSQALHIMQVGRSTAEAHPLTAESLALARKAGRPDLIATTLNVLGWHTWCLGDYALANAQWQEGVSRCDELGLWGENAWALDCLGFAAWCQGDMVAAERYIETALAIYSEVGRQSHIAMCMAELALVQASIGRMQRAIDLARRAVAITHAIDGQLMLTISLNYLGAVLLAISELGEARHILLEAVQRAWDHEFSVFIMVAFYYFAELLERESRTIEQTGALQHRRLAVTLLSRVRTDASTWQAFRDKAAALLADIERVLPAKVFAAAQQEGDNRTVAELVGIVLGEEPNVRLAQSSPASVSHPDDPVRSSRITDPAIVALVEPLSERELDILRLLAQGYTNQQIAEALTVVVGTVKTHNHHIFGKLGVSNRVQALMRARQLKLV